MELNGKQFDGVASWDERMAGRTHMPAEGTMSLTEARSNIDPVFKDWGKFHRQEAGYIGGLAEHVKARGVLEPIVLDERNKIYDGHHRLAAAELAGHSEIPWRRIDRPVNPYEDK